MTISRILLPLALAAVLAGCQSFGFGGASGPQLREGTWRCSNGVTLTLVRDGARVQARDSRGHGATMPASPPGQTTRYAEGIHALILEGRDATWFVSGQKPMECRR